MTAENQKTNCRQVCNLGISKRWLPSRRRRVTRRRCSAVDSMERRAAVTPQPNVLAQRSRRRHIGDMSSDADSGVPSQRQRSTPSVYGGSLGLSGANTPSRAALSDITNLQSASGAAPRSRASSQGSLVLSVHASQISTAHSSQAGSQAALPFDRPAEETEYIVARVRLDAPLGCRGCWSLVAVCAAPPQKLAPYWCTCGSGCCS